jgi:hypothetical protein
MHELSIVMSILDIAKSEALKANAFQINEIELIKDRVRPLKIYSHNIDSDLTIEDGVVNFLYEIQNSQYFKDFFVMRCKEIMYKKYQRF